MSRTNFDQLLEAGCHFGHLRRKWNPAMAPYIFPRRTGKYISAFLGFAPANNPQIMGLILIDEPVGVYYGGTIAAPVLSDLFANILPYFGMDAEYKEEKIEKENP